MGVGIGRREAGDGISAQDIICRQNISGSTPRIIDSIGTCDQRFEHKANH